MGYYGVLWGFHLGSRAASGHSHAEHLFHCVLLGHRDQQQIK